MNKTAQIYKLPSPIMAVIRHDDGSVTYSFAPTLYQAREEARRAGAAEITLTPWQRLNLDGEAPAFQRE